MTVWKLGEGTHMFPQGEALCFAVIYSGAQSATLLIDF